ncbi:MAG: hypothetical protein HPY61_08950 [Methanotrichaceae archaeon]|nr:hypothetical protein [Methanotrichaceae archaeon]
MDGVSVMGDLELNKSQYYPIKIINSVIEGNISCNGITFFENINFENTTFERSALFNGTNFMKEANFNNSRFSGNVSFNMSRFPEGGTFDYAFFGNRADFGNVWFDKFATFYNATFSQNAPFYLSQFNGAYANFEFTHFLKDADFTGSSFNTYGSFEGTVVDGYADLHATLFDNGANFYSSSFLGPANFERSYFSMDSIFSDASFRKEANFVDAKFSGPTYFDSSRFEGDVSFDNAQFLSSADFRGAAFDEDLSLNSTKITKMDLEGAVFGEGSKLFLAKADINRLMVPWEAIENVLSYDTSAFLSMVKNYKDLGQSSDANDCYYVYRHLNQMHKEIGASKFLDVVAWLSCGYGVRPHYALYCGAFIILLFSIALFLGRGVHGFEDLHGWHLAVASLYYSTIAFTANSKGLPFNGHYKYLGIAEGIIGWLLMALFLVTLGRLMIG